MPADSERLESTILRILCQRQMSFNQILEALEMNGLDVTGPRLSRRLKKLVEAGAVVKTVIPGWPPSTSYSLMSEAVQTPPSPPKSRIAPNTAWGRLPWIVSALLGAGLLIAFVAAYWQGQRCRSLETGILGKEVELSYLRGRLATMTDSFQRAEQKLSSTTEALVNTQNLVRQTNRTLFEKDSELADLETRLESAELKLRTSISLPLAGTTSTSSDGEAYFAPQSLIPGTPPTGYLATRTIWNAPSGTWLYIGYSDGRTSLIRLDPMRIGELIQQSYPGYQ